MVWRGVEESFFQMIHYFGGNEEDSLRCRTFMHCPTKKEGRHHFTLDELFTDQVKPSFVMKIKPFSHASAQICCGQTEAKNVQMPTLLGKD
jgi:hypothetical protein